MKKWFKTLQAFGAYGKGVYLCPEGLHRESLQVRGLITRQPVFMGAKKPTDAESEAWLRATQSSPPPVAPPTPVIEAAVAPEPETATAPAPEPPRRRRGRPRKPRHD